MIFLYEICDNYLKRLKKKAPMWDVYGEPRGPKASLPTLVGWCGRMLDVGQPVNPKEAPVFSNQNKGLLGVSSMLQCHKLQDWFGSVQYQENFDTLGISWEHGRRDMHACFLMLSDMSTSAGALDISRPVFLIVLVWQQNREPSLNLLNCGIVNRFYRAMLLLATACWERLFTK